MKKVTSIFSIFSCFNHDFIDFPRIAASNAETYDVIILGHT